MVTSHLMQKIKLHWRNLLRVSLRKKTSVCNQDGSVIFELESTRTDDSKRKSSRKKGRQDFIPTTRYNDWEPLFICLLLVRTLFTFGTLNFLHTFPSRLDNFDCKPLDNDT